MMTPLKVVAVVLAVGAGQVDDATTIRLLEAENKALRAQVAAAAPTITRLNEEKEQLQRQLVAVRQSLDNARAELAALQATIVQPKDAKRREFLATLEAMSKLIRTAADGSRLMADSEETTRRLHVAAAGLGFTFAPVATYDEGLAFQPPSGARVSFKLRRAPVGGGVGRTQTIRNATIDLRGLAGPPPMPITDQMRKDMLALLQPWYTIARQNPTP